MAAAVIGFAGLGLAGLNSARDHLRTSDLSSAQPRGTVPGRVTGLPVPRYVSMKAAKAFVRVGPGEQWQAQRVYTRRGVPLAIIDEYDHWRRVRDADGHEGWVHKNMLSSGRTALVLPPTLTVRSYPDLRAPAAAVLEKNVITKTEECRGDWCRVRDTAYNGWVPRSAVWGIASYEGN